MKWLVTLVLMSKFLESVLVDLGKIFGDGIIIRIRFNMSSNAESENLCFYFKINKDNVSCFNDTFEFSNMKFKLYWSLLKLF